MTASARGSQWRWMLAGGLVLLSVLVFATVAALATGDGTRSYRHAVAFAAAVCGGGSLGGWLASRWPYRTPAAAVAGGLAGVFLRITPPLAALAWLEGKGGDAGEAGADRLLIGLYLLMLAADVALNVVWSLRFHRPGREKIAN